jgi:hypothetical protein
MTWIECNLIGDFLPIPGGKTISVKIAVCTALTLRRDKVTWKSAAKQPLIKNVISGIQMFVWDFPILIVWA